MWGCFLFVCFVFFSESGINPSALISFLSRDVTQVILTCGGKQSSEGQSEKRKSHGGVFSPTRTLLPLSSPFTPRRSTPLHLSPALSPAPSLSPLLNWHRSGWKHDNRKAFRRGALSGSPRPRSPPTQISRRQRGGRREDRSVLPTGAPRE